MPDATAMGRGVTVHPTRASADQRHGEVDAVRNLIDLRAQGRV
jgi:hypothetical protein